MSADPATGLRIPRAQLAGLAAIGLAQAAMVVGLFVLLRSVVEALETGTATLARLAPTFLLLLVVTALYSVTRGIQFAVGERMGYLLVRRLRMRMYDHLGRMYVRQMQHRSRGALLLRFSGDLTMFRTWVSRGVAPAIVGAIAILVGTAAVMYVDLWLGIGMLGALLGGAALSVSLGLTLQGITRRIRRRRSLLTSNIQEQVTSLGTVQAFGRFGGERDRLAEQNDRMTRSILRETEVRGLLRTIAAASGWFAVVVVLVIGTIEVGAGRASAASVVAASIACRLLSTSVRDVALAHDYWRRSKISERKIVEFLSSSASRPAQPEAQLHVSRGRIVLDRVRVAGSLEDLSAVAEPGEVVVLTGPPGSGKTTLLEAIAALVEVRSGRVLIDDQDVAACTPKSVARRIGVLAPDLPLMRGTIRRNLTYRLPDASDDELVRVVMACRLDEVLTSLGGLDAWLSEGGGGLSSGQRQLVALARAIMGNPPILLLDDPTAHLDAPRAELVRRLVTHHHGTVVVATSDPEILAWADRSWTLDGGRLTETVLRQARTRAPRRP